MDTLISNVTIVTMNERMEVLFGAYLGVENGKIAYIGKTAPDAQPKTIVDGTGMVLMPGLVNCHTQLATTVFRSYCDDLTGSQALDEPDLGNAVQKTLRPHLNGTALRIRFNVSRRLVSDQTAHAVLRILRELAANALRHGHARNLTVAGCLDGRLLKFSLADDGAGFDPAHAAGVEHGHFGLSGIHDRVNKMHGTFEISSEPGRGTKAVVTLNAQ